MHRGGAVNVFGGARIPDQKAHGFTPPAKKGAFTLIPRLLYAIFIHVETCVVCATFGMACSEPLLSEAPFAVYKALNRT